MFDFIKENKAVIIAATAGMAVGALALWGIQEAFPSNGKKLDRVINDIDKELGQLNKDIQNGVR